VSSTTLGRDQLAGAASCASPITRSYSKVLIATALRLPGLGLDVSGMAGEWSHVWCWAGSYFRCHTGSVLLSSGRNP